MNERIGPMYVPDEQEDNYTGEKPYSNNLGSIVDIESRKLVQSTYLKAEEVLKTNRDKLVKVILLPGKYSKNLILSIFYSWPKPCWRRRH